MKKKPRPCLFSELNERHLRSDMHMHSTWTDGEATIHEIIAKASGSNLINITVTDHIRRNSDYFPEYTEEIATLRRKSSFNIFAGCECKINDFSGTLDLSDRDRALSEWIVASVHRFPLGRKLYKASDFTKKICQEIETELALAGIEKGGMDAIGHAGGMSIRSWGVFETRYMEEVIAACKRYDVAFEFNSAYHKVMSDAILLLLKKYDPLVSFGSDAHKLSHVGEHYMLTREWLLK